MNKFNTTLEAFDHWVNNSPNHIFLRQPKNRKFTEYTYQQADLEARKIAKALQNLGIPQGSHVALLSKNCAHWIMADLAIMMAGYVSIPIYPTLGADSINEILIHSESKAIIIGNLDNYEKQRPGIPAIPKIGIQFYGIEEESSWEQLIETNEPLQDTHHFNPDDLLTILYTSGTTGNPKGVMHKTAALNQVTNTAIGILKLPEHIRYFSYLPMTHIAERIAMEQTGIYLGNTFTFPESLPTFAEDLASVQPYLFFGVPRIWQKFQEKILEKMPEKKLNRMIGLPLIGGIIKKKIRQKLGLNEAKLCFSGAAPISLELQKWFKKLGVTVLQAYGMTEDCILSHYNLPEHNKFGTVGRPLPGVTSKLSEEGEVLIKSDCLMLGYFKEKEKTDEMFTEDGFLKTGDLGEFDHDGFLSITGRAKDQFKTDKGKYVSPGPIELELSKNIDIDQVCVVGTGISQPIALIVPSASGRVQDKQVFEDSILETINTVNKKLQKHETVEKAVIMKEDWSVDNGLMTPTLKVKRNRVENIHQHMYPKWFEHPDKVVYEN
ncbi:MAG: AMP-binding protein [Cyclobacteriaceae bacterium]|nr:AMP-binding protein [Cyclobacteriaceae bacterium]